MHSLPHLLFLEVSDRLLNRMMTSQIQARGGIQQCKTRFHQSEQV